MTKTIRWGIIGVGNVCEVKSGPGFQKATNSELVAVMRRDGDLAKDFAERHGVPKWYDDATPLINDPDVDAVYIATPPHVHLEYTEQIAKAGKPVFVEKPMARSFKECQAMVDVCAKADVPLWVAYYRRALPRFIKLKQLIESKAIGEVNTVSVTLRNKMIDVSNGIPWRVQPEISGGGLFVDVGVHMLDYLEYVFGAIQSVGGATANHGGQYPAEDNVVAHFVFESGVTGAGVWDFNGHDHLDQTVIVGTEGTLTYSTFGTDAIRLMTADGEQLIDVATPPHVHQPLIQTIVDELNGNGECPSTGISGARTTWVTDQIYGI